MKTSTRIIAHFAGWICLAVLTTQAATNVDFVADIQPILQKNCIKCHGPEKAKGDLRLDSKAAAMKGGKDAPTIVPGDSAKSDLYHRITLPAGDDDIMPSKGDPLTKAQTDLVRDWINQGAKWPDGVVAIDTGVVAPILADEVMPPYTPSSGELAAVAKLKADGTLIQPIATNANWREANFHMQGAKITDASLAPLKEIMGLMELNLAGTKITDAGLVNIAGLTNLTALHLELTGITDAGLAHLKKLSHLTYLNLYGTAVTDKGLEELKGLTNLKRLYLWQTKITEGAVAEFQKQLPGVIISRGWENEPDAKKAEALPEEKKEAKN